QREAQRLATRRPVRIRRSATPRTVRSDLGEIRELFEERARCLVGIEPDCLGIRADERPAEDPARPSGKVVAFEPFQETQAYLCSRRHRRQRDQSPLSFQPQFGTEGWLAARSAGLATRDRAGGTNERESSWFNRGDR